MKDSGQSCGSGKSGICPIVVLVAGGKGTRIQNLNSTVPKPMIPIAGKPILQWEIESVVSQGYCDIIITVSHLPEKIMDYFGDGSSFGCRISYYREEQPLGNAGALFKLYEEHRLADTFLFLVSDAVYDIDFDRFLAYHNERNALATLFVHPNSHPYDSGLVLCDSSGKVTEWLNKEDKRPQWYRNSVNAGLQILTMELLEKSGINPKCVGNGPGQRKVDLDRDILKPLISTGRICGYRSTEYCKDAGTPERFLAVEEDIRSGLVEARNLHRPQKAVFLDRDGTINKHVGFLRDIDEFALIEGVAEAVRRINQSGYLCIVVTNQPVIARGEVTVEELDMIHNKMETLLGNEGAYVDAIYYCPHHPDRGFDGEVEALKTACGCRKPKPGMLLKAARDFNIDLESSWMVGDSWSDVEAGNNAGCNTALILNENTAGDMPDGIYLKVSVRNLLEFAILI